MYHSTLERIKHSFDETNQKNTCKVLIVDTLESYRSCHTKVLEEQGFDVATAESGFKAIEVLTFFPADFVVIDCQMSDLNCFKCCEYILKIDPEIKVIFTSSLSSSELSIEVFKAGGKDLLEKPMRESALSETIAYYT